MTPHILISIVELLLIVCIVAIIAQWLKQPYSIALVLVGIFVALTDFAPPILISHDIIFTLILPPLLFQGAMHMDMEQLKNNWKSVGMLAIPGVVASTFLIGYLMHVFLGVELLYAILFGALITPTDPISVLAILKKVGTPKRLQSILEGESLFNDGTGVVIFTLVIGILSGHESFQFGVTFLEFLKVVGGGILVGLAIGYFTFHLLKKIDDSLLTVAITVVLTFGTPLLAEHFHLSGIIALVVSGLIIGNYGRHYSMNEKDRGTVETFWEVIDFLINSLLFLVIGLECRALNLAGEFFPIKEIIIIILIVLFSRLVVVYPIVGIKNLISPDHRDIPWKWSHVLFWGGLKGSLSIALVVGLPADFPYRNLFLTLSFSIVIFTLIVQGLTMKPLIKWLDISK